MVRLILGALFVGALIVGAWIALLPDRAHASCIGETIPSAFAYSDVVVAGKLGEREEFVHESRHHILVVRFPFEVSRVWKGAVDREIRIYDYHLNPDSSVWVSSFDCQWAIEHMETEGPDPDQKVIIFGFSEKYAEYGCCLVYRYLLLSTPHVSYLDLLASPPTIPSNYESPQPARQSIDGASAPLWPHREVVLALGVLIGGGLLVSALVVMEIFRTRRELR